jgi:formylglycine-generating enzyme required for sulfatase activity
VAVVEGIEFVEISPGYYRMGSRFLLDHAARKPFDPDDPGDVLGRLARPLGIPRGRPARYPREMPVHWVAFPRGFWIGRTEVTRGQYGRTAPYVRKTEAMPLSWVQSDEFGRKLAGRTGLPIRLPSESEWECACRAGTRTSFEFGEDRSLLSTYAWHRGNARGGAPDVATLRPNRWGLYDLHGGIAEWCADHWHPSYESAPADGSAWVSPGKVGTEYFRVHRGGAYGSNRTFPRKVDPDDFRSAARGGGKPGHTWRHIGCRLAFSLTPDQEPLVAPYLVEAE